MRRSLRSSFAFVLAAVALVACSGSADDDADETPESPVAESPDAGVAVSDEDPERLAVRFPGGATVEADRSAITVRPEPFADPTAEVPWDGLESVAAVLERSGLHLASCLEGPSLSVEVNDADLVYYVSGTVCDGSPEAGTLLEALAPLGDALGTDLWELENARAPEAAPPVPDGSRVEYVVTVPPDADLAATGGSFEAIEVTVTAEELRAANDGGSTTLALFGDELAVLIDGLQTADLPAPEATAPDESCGPAPTNSVVVFLGEEEALVAEYDACGSADGFDAVAAAMEPLLDRISLGMLP